MAPFGASRAGLMSTRVDTIPDSGIYLDDWLDNRISNRETYSDLQYEFFETTPEESAFDTEPERPEWTELQSTVTTSEGRVEFNDDDAERLGTSLSVDSLPDDLHLRMDFEMQNTTTRSGRSMFFAFVNETEDEDIPQGITINIFPTGSTWDLNLQIDGSTLINETDISDPTDPHFVEATRENGENWELFLDGSSVGTATDSYNATGDLFQLMSTRSGPAIQITRWELA